MTLRGVRLGLIAVITTATGFTLAQQDSQPPRVGDLWPASPGPVPAEYDEGWKS